MQLQQRLVDILLKHWHRRKGALPLPIFEQFAPEALGDDIWQNCCGFTVQKSAGKWVFTNEFTGELVQHAIGRDMTGEVFTSGAPKIYEMRLVEKAEEMLRLGDALTDEGHFVNEKDKIVKFRSCLLPFARNGSYTHVVLGLSWRKF